MQTAQGAEGGVPDDEGVHAFTVHSGLRIEHFSRHRLRSACLTRLCSCSGLGVGGVTAAPTTEAFRPPISTQPPRPLPHANGGGGSLHGAAASQRRIRRGSAEVPPAPPAEPRARGVLRDPGRLGEVRAALPGRMPGPESRVTRVRTHGRRLRDSETVPTGCGGECEGSDASRARTPVCITFPTHIHRSDSPCPACGGCSANSVRLAAPPAPAPAPSR